MDSLRDQVMAMDDEEFFNMIPTEYRFIPSDDVLLVHYLNNKVLNKPLPKNYIKDVNIYRYHPQELSEKYQIEEDAACYFFSPRYRKYPNGKRPDRAAGEGYWKASGAEKHVNSNGQPVGLKQTLVYYLGNPKVGKKTSWIMHEYRVLDDPNAVEEATRASEDMLLDECVLCKIYKTPKKGERNQQSDSEMGSMQADEDAMSEVQEEDMLQDGEETKPIIAPVPNFQSSQDPMAGYGGLNYNESSAAMAGYGGPVESMYGFGEEGFTSFEFFDNSLGSDFESIKFESDIWGPFPPNAAPASQFPEDHTLSHGGTIP